ncbi:MAG: peptidoglycan DD-metalloendopeptidase family protein [Pseudomonadota bacterium]
MKRVSFKAGSGLIFTCLLLAGCFSQRPAPVSLYGTSAGAGSAGIHTVTKDENLWAISQRYNIVMRDIVVSNSLRAPFILNPGQRLELPPPRTYRVRVGDSLYTISRLNEVSTSEIAALNNLRAPYTVRPGQILKLPSVTPKTMPAVMRTASLAPPSVEAPTVERAAPVPEVGRGEVLSEPMVTPGKKPEILAQPEAPKASVKKASVTRGKIPSSTPARSSSKFLKPVDGQIISSYGPKKNGQHNDGINIKAPRGSAVKAAENGVVVYAGNEIKGFGNLILVRHADRWMTAYAHLDDMKVGRGQTIKRGDVIGAVGSTGSVDSPQLHFEVRRGTDAINPKKYLES